MLCALWRAVVRTLLRRHVKRRLIAWYWAEAAVRRKYAGPRHGRLRAGHGGAGVLRGARWARVRTECVCVCVCVGCARHVAKTTQVILLADRLRAQ